MIVKKHCTNFIEKLESFLNIFIKFPIIGLLLIGLIGILIRVIFLDTDLPIRQDANAYFWYAMDMSILKHIPDSGHSNDGWPIFLSFFFSIFHFENYLDYTSLQRVVTIIISVVTIIPIYFLAKKFVSSGYAVFATAIFVFEPHIIQNSLQGLTEPFYIFLVTLAIMFFLMDNIRLKYVSFAIIALSVIVRAEGIIILFIISIAFFAFQKRDKKIVGKYILALLIFGLIFGAMMILKTQSEGYPSSIGFIMNVGVGSIVDSDSIPDSTSDRWNITFSDIVSGVSTLIKRLGQTLIPYFAFFLPFGIILLLQNRTKNNIFILLLIGIYILALIRIFVLVQDIRLILVLYPLFSLISAVTFEHLTSKIEINKILLILTIFGILVLSWFTLYSTIESEYAKENVQFANTIKNNIKVSNNFYPESGYIYGAWVASNVKFPALSSSFEYTGPKLLDYVDNSYEYLEKNANSVEEYINLGRSQGLEHLIVDGKENRVFYFNDVYNNPENYPYLIKDFDSREMGYKHYFVKVFRINYEIFDSYKK